MTAPLAPQTLDCPAMLIAGMAAAGVAVTASRAAPIVCDCCWEFTCPDGAHYWLTPTPAQTAAWQQNGDQP